MLSELDLYSPVLPKATVHSISKLLSLLPEQYLLDPQQILSISLSSFGFLSPSTLSLQYVPYSLSQLF